MLPLKRHTLKLLRTIFRNQSGPGFTFNIIWISYSYSLALTFCNIPYSRDLIENKTYKFQHQAV